MTDMDYLDRYYGTYMRALTNPSTQSLTGDLNEENIATLEAYAHNMLNIRMGREQMSRKTGPT